MATEDPIRPTKATVIRFIATYVSLMILLALTIWSSFIKLDGFNSAINLGIAAAKALLVGIFYMHLHRASAVTKLFAIAALLWLTIMFGLTLSDYMTRPGREAINYASPNEPRVSGSRI